MLAALKRHPIPIEAFFRHSLVLTYAYPEALLAPLLPPGLTLDTFEGHGFLAIALVQTRGLRPSGWPAFLGQGFFLSGYRIFTRFQHPDGRTLRGLKILRSDTDSALMARVGNLLTHYRYARCTATVERSDAALRISIRTPGAVADLDVCAALDHDATAPPAGSPFRDLLDARRFAGPLPFTFDHEPESRSMVIIQGRREHWQPRPVEVAVATCTFLQGPPFNAVPPRLANAFLVEDVPYRWERGLRVPLPHPAP